MQFHQHEWCWAEPCARLLWLLGQDSYSWIPFQTPTALHRGLGTFKWQGFQFNTVSLLMQKLPDIISVFLTLTFKLHISSSIQYNIPIVGTSTATESSILTDSNWIQYSYWFQDICNITGHRGTRRTVDIDVPCLENNLSSFHYQIRSLALLTPMSFKNIVTSSVSWCHKYNKYSLRLSTKKKGQVTIFFLNYYVAFVFP